MTNLTTVLGADYSPEYLQTQAVPLAQQLKETGIVMLPRFLNPTGLNALQKECQQLKVQAYTSQSSYNVYVQPDDPNFGPDSARNRRCKTTKRCVPNDRIPSDSVLRTVYDAPEFRNFIAQLVGAKGLFPYDDTLSSININYYDPGDALEWHFDNSDFTITLLAQTCRKGGVYEYCTDMRYTQDGEENYPLVEQILAGQVKPEQAFVNAGDLMIFRGNKSLHRVTPIEEGNRILITFNFNDRPGVALSEESRKTFFGRTK